MTHADRYRGASSASDNWLSINWKQVESSVFQIQMRIAKAAREKRWGKVKAIQRLLTRSHHAKLLAVKRVTTSQGRRTPGIDGIVWGNTTQKWVALTCPPI